MKGRKDIREKIKGVQEEATDKAEQELDKTINNVLGNKIGMTHTLNVDLDANELYKELNIWLSKQSDALYNAFMMLLMKDFVNLIKEDIQKLTNIDIRLLGDNLNTFDDLIYLLDMLGLNETTPTLPLESILTTGLNSVFAINNSFKTMLREIDVPKLG